MLAIGFAPLEIAKAVIEETKKATDKPFGANIIPFLPWAQDVLNLYIAEKVPVVEFSSDPYHFENLESFTKQLKAAGIHVIAKTAGVEEAKFYERIGCDAVIAKGYEGGGHVYALTSTMALTPSVVDAVNIPVIAASGIADGRGIAASFMLGAEAVEIGSRFILAHESQAHENYKQAIIDSKEGDTVLTGMVTKDGVRQLRNKLSDKLIQIEKELSEEEAIKQIVEISSGSLRSAAQMGDIDAEGAVLVGQNSGLLTKRQSAEAIIQEIVNECNALMKVAPEKIMPAAGI